MIAQSDNYLTNMFLFLFYASLINFVNVLKLKCQEFIEVW